MKPFELNPNTDIAWCPGCGDFSIRKALIMALNELALDPGQVVMTSGIGQAAKMPQYVDTNFFNGLHGRGLPLAVAIKAVNPSLTVIAEGGDGDMYGEGGNHFIHNIRRNPDIAHFVHNNMIYGLTQGQGSPTSPVGQLNTVQVEGVINEPFNPLAVAVSLGATFVARAFSGDIPTLTRIMKAAITHKGYALVDIFQPCVSFNKVNTFKWYQEHTYYLDEGHDPTDRMKAMALAFETDPYPLGILYQTKDRSTYEEKAVVYQEDKTPLIHRRRDLKAVEKLLNA
ncbi:MAG: 2-oxoacid ferredoxin oxidoreductase [delta proteobacterium ML8_F1]|nr:MAG: 2-oxoacid ferredoxin oxidoreductase [delta proteobacterium ML8_F1]